jgi:hypothetical protein
MTTPDAMSADEALVAVLQLARDKGLVSARGGIRIEFAVREGRDGPVSQISAALTECGDALTYQGDGATVERAFLALWDVINPPPHQLQD